MNESHKPTTRRIKEERKEVPELIDRVQHDNTQAIAASKAAKKVKPNRKTCATCGKHIPFDDFDEHRRQCQERQARNIENTNAKPVPIPKQTDEAAIKRIARGTCPFCVPATTPEDLMEYVKTHHGSRLASFEKLYKKAEKILEQRRKAKKKPRCPKCKMIIERDSVHPEYCGGKPKRLRKQSSKTRRRPR